MVLIEGDSVFFQNENYVSNPNQYVVESGDAGNILSASEINASQNKLSDFHVRRIGKAVKIKFYSVIVNNFKFYVNKSLINVDTGSINISKLGGYIRNEKLKHFNDQTRNKISNFQKSILDEVVASNLANSNFVLYTFCRLSAIDVINGQAQAQTYYRDYLGFYGNSEFSKYAKYIRKESSNGITHVSNQRITQVIDNVINAIEVYVDGGFVPLDANYCGSSFESILNDTKANRKILFDIEVSNFKKFINANAQTNTIHYDKGVAFDPERTKFINDVLKERLLALQNNSEYKVTFFFKEIPFVIGGDSLKLFAQKCVQGSSLDDNSNIVIVIPYFAQKCDGDLYYFTFASYKGIPMPAVYCNNPGIKANIETVLSGNGELNTRLNNLFIHVPKKQTTIFAIINYEGNIIYKTHASSDNKAIGEPNVYTFKFIEDKRCKTLVANSYGCQTSGGSLGYTTSANGAVNTSQSYINVTITDLVCLKRENDKAMQTGPVLQLIVHGLKESAVANKDIVLDYVKWYAHDNIINQLIENPPPPNSCFIGGKNQAHYQNILSVLDAVSTALAPTGLDAFFDAGTAVYCLTQGETSDALLYSAAFVIPAASGGMVKGAVNGTHYFYLTIKEGKLKIPSLGTSCPMAGVGFNVAKQTNKKIYSTIANSASYNKLLTLKNDPDYTSFIVHIDDALDNTQLSSKLREGPKEVEDYFTYYKANKNKPAAEIVSGFV
ncbi:MAG: hypothetical protein SGJ15_07330, partial [Bacteroidota bacterium]|nr:hypothetical protein [Bacteroidota bacterium]